MYVPDHLHLHLHHHQPPQLHQAEAAVVDQPWLASQNSQIIKEFYFNSYSNTKYQ